MQKHSSLERIQIETEKNYCINSQLERLAIVEKIFERIPKGILLDVGCHEGEFLQQMVASGWKGKGIELTDKYKVARRKGLDCTQCNIEDGLPFTQNTFDVVFAGEIIEHLADTDLFLEECNRVLKKSGTLIITTPNIADLYFRWVLLKGLAPLDPFAKGGHIRHYSLPSLRQHLICHGFAIKESHGLGLFFPLLWRSEWLSGSLDRLFSKIGFTRLFPNLCKQLIVVAEKK